MRKRRVYDEKLPPVFGKRLSAHIVGRDTCATPKPSTIKFQPILDYILSHASDERPYLEVDILGIKLLGLLDSGASVTILGSKGWAQVKHLGLILDDSKKTSIRVANGETCDSYGECQVPFVIREKLKLVTVLVVIDLSHVLVLGANFWKQMGIVPDLRRNEWHFSRQEELAELNQIRDATVLTVDEEHKLKVLIGKYKDVMNNKLGCTTEAEHVIQTHSQPIKQRYYPVQRQINKELDDMLEKGIVEPSNSAWSSPILLVQKIDGSYRFCVDFRKLNAVTERDSYPLPYVSHTLDKLRDARYLSTLDVKSAFWQVSVEKGSRQYSAFTVPGRGLF